MYKLLVKILIICTIFEFLHGLEISIKFDPSNLKITKKLGYDYLQLGDLPHTTEISKPSVPYKIINVAIPSATTVKEVLVKKCQSDVLDGEFFLMPAQSPRHVNDNSEAKIVSPNPKVYSSTKPYPLRTVEIIGQGDIAGQKIVTLRVFPVRFIPASRKLIFNREIRLDLVLESSQPAPKIRLNDRTRKVYEELIKTMVINPENVRLTSGAPKFIVLPEGEYEYVIITPYVFKQAFYPLVEWKTEKGVRATIVTTEWIYRHYSGTNGAEKIRNFIIDANTSWGAIWFLLGGDADFVPVKEEYYVGEWVPGDHYYSDYDDDWFCEVFVGRAPVRTPEEASVFVEKVIEYETAPNSNYLKKLLFIGMDLDQWTHSEDLKDYVAQNIIPPEFTIVKVYDSNDGNHREAALAALNAGQHIVNHCDHSQCERIGVGFVNHGLHLYKEDIDALNNFEKPCIFYSVGCWSCAFDQAADCFAEHFMLHTPHRGAVAYIGNTRFGWYNYGDIFVYSGKMDIEWWKSFLVFDRYRIGEALADSKNRNYPVDAYYRYVHHELTLLGDPEMPIWTNFCGYIQAEYRDTILIGYQDFTVHVESGHESVRDATVCLYMNGEIYEVGQTNENGDVVFQVNAQTEGEISLTVTKRNYAPHRGKVIVLSCYPGDVNGDGTVNTADINYLYYKLSSNEAVYPQCADVNGDCKVDEADLEYLRDYLFSGGSPPVKPCSRKMWLLKGAE